MEQVIERYIEIKETLSKVEGGTWKNDPEVHKLSIEQIENMRYIVDTLNAHGFEALAERFRKVN